MSDNGRRPVNNRVEKSTSYAESRGSGTRYRARGREAGTDNYTENINSNYNPVNNSKRSLVVGNQKRKLTKREKIQKKALRNAATEREWNRDIERIRTSFDWVFFTILVILLSIGVVMVYTASYPTAIRDYDGNGFYFAGKQLKWIALGMVALGIMAIFPTRYLQKASKVISGFSIILLILVLFIGKSAGGAQRWIKITSSLKIQPSEIGKIAMTIMLASYAAKYDAVMKDPFSKKNRFLYGVLFPSFIIFLYSGLVLLEKHLSGMLIISLIGGAVLFLSGSDWKLLAPYFGGLVGVVSFVYLITHPYALQRITSFTSEDVDILDEGWQTYQGLLAIGSGGPFGLGLGQSRQKYAYVAEAQNDFIFTIWCEEMGFIGAVIIIVLFMALLYRGYRIALRAPDKFSSLLVFGIMTQMGLQALLNIMVVSGTAPNTGVSLPFLSYGGTSLIMFMAEMGMVLAVSRRSYQKIK